MYDLNMVYLLVYQADYGYDGTETNHIGVFSTAEKAMLAGFQWVEVTLNVRPRQGWTQDTGWNRVFRSKRRKITYRLRPGGYIEWLKNAVPSDPTWKLNDNESLYVYPIEIDRVDYANS